MSFHRDLLDQADLLAKREPRKPKQANLRRAVSGAYYAVFHLLVDAGSRFLISGSQRTPLRLCLSRAFAHADMKAVAGLFSRGQVPDKIAPALKGAVIQNELRLVADAFVELQQAPHEADYDLSRQPFTRQEVQDLIAQARKAFRYWDAMRGTPQAEDFLVALLAHRHIKS